MEKNEEDAQVQRYRLAAAEDKDRSCPAFWKLIVPRDALASGVQLQVLSDLSAECCHVPFTIELSKQFKAKHAQFLVTGANLLSFLPPEVTASLREVLANGPLNPLHDVVAVHFADPRLQPCRAW